MICSFNYVQFYFIAKKYTLLHYFYYLFLILLQNLSIWQLFILFYIFLR
ncbi:hypothetical protein [Neisseria meningitidis serogroup B]|uniref:Uncharacterized protein n=1 Tax=Neisseria meningitidis serogroup B TaxID=491 RepID=A0A0H5QS75_NEIMI|nr:hypothetical protein [Neisseria meningitidis serogroup B]